MFNSNLKRKSTANSNPSKKSHNNTAFQKHHMLKFGFEITQRDPKTLNCSFSMPWYGHHTTENDPTSLLVFALTLCMNSTLHVNSSPYTNFKFSHEIGYNISQNLLHQLKELPLISFCVLDHCWWQGHYQNCQIKIFILKHIYNEVHNMHHRHASTSFLSTVI